MHAQHAVSKKGCDVQQQVKEVKVRSSQIKQDVAYSMDVFFLSTHIRHKTQHANKGKREKTKRKTGRGKAKNKNSKV